MAVPQPVTPGDRDEHLRRLRRITTSVAIGGVVAVGWVGYVAAASNPGQGGGTAAPQSSGGDGSGFLAGGQDDGGLGQQDGSGLQAPQQNPGFGGFGGGQVRTGGS